jgi:hypothetical protein
MSIVLYNNYYEFHFAARLKTGQLVRFLNSLPPLNFHFELNQHGIFADYERKPGVFTLQEKKEPHEEIPKEQANFYIRWQARASEGDVPRMAFRLAHDLSRELETQVWLVDGYGRIMHSEGGEQLSA